MATTKFKYKQMVKIVDGFYEGSVGVVMALEGALFAVDIDGQLHGFAAHDLENYEAPKRPLEGDEEMPSDEQMLMWSTNAFDEMEAEREQAKQPEITP